MKSMIIYTHPNPNSFNHAILETVQSGLQAKGHEVVVRDLYAMDFEPVLRGSDLQGFRSGAIPPDILAEQEHIRATDLFVLMYPIWWTGLPAMLKGYIDRVLSYGFAYQYGEGGNVVPLLTGKKALLISTHGTPKEIYDQIGMTEALKQTADKGIFEFCGIEVINHLFFGSVPQVDDAARKQMLEEVNRTVAALG